MSEPLAPSGNLLATKLTTLSVLPFSRRKMVVRSGEFAKIGGEPSFVHKFVAAPVEQHLHHRLLVMAGESRQQIDDLSAPRGR